MYIHKIISKVEYRYLLILGFIIVVLAFSANVKEISQEYNKYVIEQQAKLLDKANGTNNHFEIFIFKSDHRPIYRLLIFIFSIIVLFTLKKGFYIPITFTLISCLFYLLWHFAAVYRYSDYYEYTDGNFIKMLQANANVFDYFATIVVFALVFWQISILFRMLRFKKEIVLV